MQSTADLLSHVNDDDMMLIETLRRDFGECSLPAATSIVHALRQLDASSVSSLVCLDHATVNSISRQHSLAGVDDFTALFLHVVQTLHMTSGESTAKRRRYDDNDDAVNNYALSSSSSAAAAYLQQDQSWNTVADYHSKHQRH